MLMLYSSGNYGIIFAGFDERAYGTINNYVDQMIPKFDPHPPRMDKRCQNTIHLVPNPFDMYRVRCITNGALLAPRKD